MQELQISRRLVNVGEEIEFSFSIDPASVKETVFQIFPRYLQNCDPQKARASLKMLAWLDELPSISPKLSWRNGQSRFSYTPVEPGSYLARLHTSQGTVYRYFAAVTAEYVVYRMLAYSAHQPPPDGPEMRNGGIPIDWAMAVSDLPTTLNPAKRYLERLLEYQRVFDDVVMPFYSTGWEAKGSPSFDLGKYIDTALSQMRAAGLQVERAVLDWQAYSDSVAEYRNRGFEVVDGIIQESEIHRGAPWFPYWLSTDDFLSPDASSTRMMGMIMDFCAGFHFHGPPDFHMLASECDWNVAAPHADLAAREHALIPGNSGSGPVFVPTLLIFKYTPWGLMWPARNWPEEEQLSFVKNFIDDTVFEHSRKYPIVFARCVDIADYLRDHQVTQPRRIVSSITHDWPYDRVWSPEWCNAGVDVHQGVLPFGDSLGDIRRRRPFIWAKPTAREMIYYEDSISQCRFEYRCPKPLLWYNYADRRRAGKLSGRPETEVPDPKLEMTAVITGQSYEITYHIKGGSEFADYKLAVWDVPRDFADYFVKTSAKDFILVKNSDGDYRGILVFDLKPEMLVSVSFSR